MTGSLGGRAVRWVFLTAVFLVPGAALRAATRPGVIRVEVDETHAPQRILHTRLTIPVQAGPLALYYPQWIPGEHMPDGPINNIAGLKFTAGRKAIPWRRDLLDMFEFHLEIPAGVTSLDVSFDFLISGEGWLFLRRLCDNQSERPELEPGGALSAGLRLQRHYLRAQPEAAGGMEIWNGSARRQAEWRHDQLRARFAEHSR